MLRILIVLAAFMLASCNSMSHEPSPTQLSECISTTVGGVAAPVGYRLEQLIAAAEEKHLEVSWRARGEGRFALIMNKTNPVTEQRANMVFMFEERTVTPSEKCPSTGLVTLGMIFNDEASPAIVTQSVLDSLVGSYLESQPDASAPQRTAELPSTDPAPAPIGPVGEKISQIFQPEMLNASIAYLETNTGPAFSSYGHVSVYKIDGCEVVALASNTRQIKALGMRGMDERCHFDMGRFYPGMPAYPTYGQLSAQFDGHWREDCPDGECGNAFDPETYFQYKGPHSDMYREVVAYDPTPLSDDADSANVAAAPSRAAPIDPAQFTCEGEAALTSTQERLWTDKRPGALFVGLGMVRDSCQVPVVDMLGR